MTKQNVKAMDHNNKSCFIINKNIVHIVALYYNDSLNSQKISLKIFQINTRLHFKNLIVQKVKMNIIKSKKKLKKVE